MEVLKIQSTENTPSINFDHQQFSFELGGESRPEDVRKFYDPVVNWLDEFNKYLYWLSTNNSSAMKPVEVHFKLDYFNSSSAKYIMDIMSKLSEIQQNCPGANVLIHWHYDEMDEDMIEAGEEFQKITNIPFKFHTI